MKINAISFKSNGEIIDKKSLEPNFTDCIEIPLYDNKKEKHLTRAQEKEELQKMIRDYENGIER